jgi:hypothetical protein
VLRVAQEDSVGIRLVVSPALLEKDGGWELPAGIDRRFSIIYTY